VLHCHTFGDAVPPLDTLDAESCHLGFELRLASERTLAEIESVFEFAREDCSIVILPPAGGAR
jgi:two-component system, chemotaxis family, sensor kinase CheA